MHLRHRPPPTPPGSCTLSPALAAAPTGAAVARSQVIGGEFVAVAAAGWRQDGPPDAFRTEEREY